MENYLITNSSTQELFGYKKISLDEVITKLANETVIAIDTETTSLSFIDGGLLMVQLSVEGSNFIIDAQTVDVEPLNIIFSKKTVTAIAHNGVFDINFLRMAGVELAVLFDTMLMAKVVTLGKDLEYTLGAVLKRTMRIELDKSIRNTFIGHSGDFTLDQVTYGSEDTSHLLTLRRILMAEIERLQLTAVAALENQVAMSFAECTFNGIFLDQPEWLALKDISFEEREAARVELNKMLIAEFSPDIDLFGEPDIKWTSHKQVLALFKRIDPELESVGRPVLERIIQKHPIIKQYIAFKKADKRISTYGESFFKNLHNDGKMHTRFNQMVITGRVSSSGCNLQQLPREGGFRECFKPPPGHLIVAADYNSQELAVIAHGAQEPLWLETIRNGGDLHSVNAAEIFGDEFTSETDPVKRKVKRNSVKQLSFLLTYGGGAFSLANKLEIPEREAEELIERYFSTFPKIKQFLVTIGKHGMNSGLTSSYAPFRRRREFPYWKGRDTSRKELERINRQSRNYPIQSTAADLTKVAMIYVSRAIKEKGYDAKLLFPMHDELVTSCRVDQAEAWKTELELQMALAADVILENGLLTAGAEISTVWQKLQ